MLFVGKVRQPEQADGKILVITEFPNKVEAKFVSPNHRG
jgi:hypothetical protein